MRTSIAGLTKPKRKRKGPEAAFQKQVASYLWRTLPPDIVWFHIPNGERRNAATGRKLKEMGAKAGVPDLALILPPYGKFIGIELKIGKGEPSESQIDMHAAIQVSGGLVFVCRTLIEVEGVLRALELPLRGGIAA